MTLENQNRALNKLREARAIIETVLDEVMGEEPNEARYDIFSADSDLLEAIEKIKGQEATDGK